MDKCSLIYYIHCFFDNIAAQQISSFFPPHKLSSFEVFIIGAVAKAVATTVTYPLQTIQSILRVGFMLFAFVLVIIYMC